MSKITDFEDMYLQCMTRPIFSAAFLVHYNNSTCLRSSLVTVIITSTTWTTLAAHSTEITMVPLRNLQCIPVTCLHGPHFLVV